MTTNLELREISILIADDHPIFRQGLKQVIQLDPRLKVVAEAGSGEEALGLMTAVELDVAILDVDMPSGDGFTTARALLSRQKPVPVIFLTLYKDEMHVNEGLNIGAKGYLVKDSAARDVVQCIKTVVSGAHYVSPSLSDCLVRRHQSFDSLKQSSETAFPKLTPAERRILKHLADYKTNRQIAQELGVSVRTIENHRANLCEKLGLQGSHALVRFAIKSMQTA